jgi:hypothetical protein
LGVDSGRSLTAIELSIFSRRSSSPGSARWELLPTEEADLVQGGGLLAEARRLQAVGKHESHAAAAERIAYGVLVGALEEGLVATPQHAMDVLRRFSAPAGALG